MLRPTLLIRTLLTNKITNQFSSAQKIADWQYVAKIHKNLKENNVQQAFNYLINSNLDGVILDRQTFYNVHLKMNETKVDQSYQQIAYKLYRESFSPHILMAEWMKMLINTKNNKLYELLQKDFKAINLQVPKKIIPIKQPVKIQSSAKTKNIPQQQSQKISKVQQRENKKIDQKSLQKNLNIEVPQKIAQIFEKTSNLQQFVNILKNNHNIKIVIHDFELEMKPDDKADFKNFQDPEQLQEVQQQEGEVNQVQELLYKLDEFLDVLASISKIKVGKIDISITNNPEGSGQNKDK